MPKRTIDRRSQGGSPSLVALAHLPPGGPVPVPLVSDPGHLPACYANHIRFAPLFSRPLPENHIEPARSQKLNLYQCHRSQWARPRKAQCLPMSPLGTGPRPRILNVYPCHRSEPAEPGKLNVLPLPSSEPDLENSMFYHCRRPDRTWKTQCLPMPSVQNRPDLKTRCLPTVIASSALTYEAQSLSMFWKAPTRAGPLVRRPRNLRA